MGKADFHKPGDWNAICDVCGFKFKASELRKRWDGVMVCKKDWEPRHPQELIRIKADNQNVPFVRDDPDPTFLNPGDVSEGDL